MKRRLSTIITICAVALLAASCNSDKFTIKADIAQLADQKVFLNRPGLHGLEPVDTAEAVDGKFIFKGESKVARMIKRPTHIVSLLSRIVVAISVRNA